MIIPVLLMRKRHIVGKLLKRNAVSKKAPLLLRKPASKTQTDFVNLPCDWWNKAFSANAETSIIWATQSREREWRTESMSMKCFLALEQPLQKTAYKYKDILPTIRDGDMWFDGGIAFRAALTEQEKQCLHGVFQGFCLYAIDSEFGLDHETRYRSVISETYAANALEELRWLKAFAKKQLLKQDVFGIVSLWLGRKTEIEGQRTIDVNEWELSAENDFSFDRGVIYRFVDRSEEAAERRRQRANRFSV